MRRGEQNRRMLRLAPSRPPLWRTESSVQLGADGAVVVDEITPWQEGLLDALAGGIPDAMLGPLAATLGASAEDAVAFVAHIAGALTSAPAQPIPVDVEMPPDIGFAETEALASAWRAAGIETARTTRWAQEDPDPGRPLVLIADRIVEPRRTAALMAADITHLPIELAGDRVAVGPLVIPGRTACLTCRHEHRADDDPHWPLVAAQLLGRERTPTDPALVIEGAILAARLLRAAGAVDRPATASVTISGGSARRTWHVHRPHARCSCRSPEGIVTAREDAAAPVSRRFEPTTATGSARLA